MRNLLKRAAIIGGLEAIYRLRADRLFPQAAGRGLIFTLHHVRPPTGNSFEPNAHLSVTPDYLRAVIEASLAAGLVPVRLEDLPDLLSDPADRRRFVCFTLDDGYRNNAEHAAPLFRQYGVPYTIFVTPGFVDRSVSLWWETAERLVAGSGHVVFDLGEGPEIMPTATMIQKILSYRRICQVLVHGNQAELTDRLNDAARSRDIDPAAIVDELVMNAEEIRALSADPLVSFGGHTMTHPRLARISEEALDYEIRQSVADVAKLSARDVTTFAYPYGTACAAGPREFEAARQAGLKLAVTTRPGMLSERTLDEPMAVNRVSLNGLYQKPQYIPALISGLPFKMRQAV